MQQISYDNNITMHVSSGKRPAGEKLFECIHWLIMCTDVKGGQ